MMTSDEISQCEDVAKKNTAVRKLLDEYQLMMDSPAVDTYLSVLSFVNTINKQLKDVSENDSFFISDDGVQEKKKSGGISDAQDKFWDRGTKFALDCNKIHGELEGLRQRMNPDQQEQVNKKRKQGAADNKAIV